jgi:DNA-directed RNA polymerase subunit RPC12/RpoP
LGSQKDMSYEIQDNNGNFSRRANMKFTYRCAVCKKEFDKRIHNEYHLNSHTKKELIEALKYWGFYHE